MLCWTDLSEGLGLKAPLGSGLSLDLLRVGVIFEDFMYPLSIERYVDEDARLVGSGTASAMDTDSHNHPDLPILTDQRAAVVPLQKNKKKTRIVFSIIALETAVIVVSTHESVQWKQNASSPVLETAETKHVTTSNSSIYHKPKALPRNVLKLREHLFDIWIKLRFVVALHKVQKHLCNHNKKLC